MGHQGYTDAPVVPERLGVITRHCQMRVLNFSASGCLIETDRRFDVGDIASIRVVMDGRELVDDVQVVRCQLIAGAGSVYHLGARFLWTNPPGATSLRTALWFSPSRPGAELR
jgi:PilZ domain